MAYKLTQEDINKYGLIGALVGEEATPEDLRIMDQGLISTAQSAIDAAPATIQVRPAAISAPAVDGPQIGEPQFTETPEQAAAKEAAGLIPPTPQAAETMQPTGAAGLMQRLGLYDPAKDEGGFNLFRFKQQETGDPFKDLNRSQRTMLAFAAIRDAGAALQGQEGTAFDRQMKSINEQRDMARKAAAREAQLKAIQQMFGMGGIGGGQAPKTPQELQAYSQNLYLLAAQGVVDPTLVKTMIEQAGKQIEAGVERQGQTEALGTSAVTALSTAKELKDMVENDPSTTGFFGWAFGQLPFTQAAAARDLAKTLESKMALGALKELKLKSGATLGSVSEKELDLLASDIAKIDLNRGAEFVKGQIDKIQDNYKRVLNEAYGQLEDPAALDAILGMPFNQFISDSMQPKAAAAPSTGLTSEDMKYIGITPN